MQKHLGLIGVIVFLFLGFALSGCGKQDTGDQVIVTSTEPANLQPKKVLAEKPAEESVVQQQEKQMQVQFINVGQAYATLIRLPNNKTMLVDCGSQRTENWLPRYLKEEGVTEIDLLVISNQNVDHVGGCLAVPKAIPVKKILNNGELVSAYASNAMKTLVGQLEIEHQTLRNYTKIVLDPAVDISLFVPYENGYFSNPKDNSIITKITFGQFSVLLMSDCGMECERKLPQGNLTTTILELADHGAARGTSEQLLNATKPQVAIISAGDDVELMPSRDARIRLYSKGVKIYATGMHGTVKVFSNGKTHRIIPQYEKVFY